MCLDVQINIHLKNNHTHTYLLLLFYLRPTDVMLHITSNSREWGGQESDYSV